MKKHIANGITISRIIFSIPLAVIPLSSAWFYICYLFCGLTDMIDGVIARKTGSASQFGARLDTVADFVFTLVCWIKLLPQMRLPLWLWVWVIAIALVKIFNIAIVLIRRKKLVSIHSTINKAAGFALFLLPLSLNFIETVFSVTAICALASLATIQEIHLVAKGQEVRS